MLKRSFDLMIATILVVIALPFFLFTALAVRLSSIGPIWYRSPRIGRGGSSFGLIRFRTVDIHRPADLPMSERVTTVGRFIRNYSLDDLPNLLNVIGGDLSIIGPRPMEPEQVDTADPIWREILSVRPGIVSPPILQLGNRYNSSPMALKKQLELAYVRRQSIGYDLQLLARGWVRFVETRGNFKRGEPKVDSIESDSKDDRL